MKKLSLLISICAVLFLLETGGANSVFAQKSKKQKKKPAAALPQNLPTVTQIDLAGLKAIVAQNQLAKRPLLVNFWATWCEPCRQEFPELVQIDAEFRSKGLDVVTVSLDDLAELKREVPIFLAEMKAAMPAYLLKTPDEGEAMKFISADWHGGLPFTILFDAEGKTVYTRQGLIKPAILRANIEKVFAKAMLDLEDAELENYELVHRNFGSTTRRRTQPTNTPPVILGVIIEKQKKQ